MKDIEKIQQMLLESYFNDNQSDDVEIVDNGNLLEFKYSMTMTFQWIVYKEENNAEVFETVPLYKLITHFNNIVDSFGFIDNYELTFFVGSMSALVKKMTEGHAPAYEAFKIHKFSPILTRDDYKELMKRAIEDYNEYADSGKGVLSIMMMVSFNPSNDKSFSHLLRDMKHHRDFIVGMNNYGNLTGHKPEAVSCVFIDKNRFEGKPQFANLVWTDLLNSDVMRIGRFLFPDCEFYLNISYDNDKNIHSMWSKTTIKLIKSITESFEQQNCSVIGISYPSDKRFEVVFKLDDIEQTNLTLKVLYNKIAKCFKQLTDYDLLDFKSKFDKHFFIIVCDSIPKGREMCYKQYDDLKTKVVVTDNTPEHRSYQSGNKTNPDKDVHVLYRNDIEELSQKYSRQKNEIDRLFNTSK